MDIKALVRNDVWKAIAAHYSLEDYTSALRDLMMLIKNIVQELSEISDVDGSKLMSKAFLGKDPKLLINKFETQTEKDTQNGIGFILQGLFFSIRNPISHEDIIYSQENADAIILFVDYILGVIDKSKGKRNVEDWISFISNEDFPNDAEYADEILNDIPSKKRLDLLIQVYRERKNIPRATKTFITKLFEVLSSNEQNQFIDVIEQEMYSCNRSTEFTNFLYIYVPFAYVKLSKATKLRIENILFGFIEQAMISDNGNTNNKNASIGTWVCDRLTFLERRDKFIDMLFKKLTDNNQDSRNYVTKFFINYIIDDSVKLNSLRKRALHSRFKAGDEVVYNHVTALISLTSNSEWAQEFEADIDSFKSVDNAETGEIPF